MKKYIELPHLKIKSKIVPKYILLPGDPARVDIIGKQLKNFKVLNQNREFRTGIGSYKGTDILICSTGIGGPSMAIATEELISAGAEIFIRVGTCGGAWRRYISNGSLIIPTACVRDEGTTLEYIPLGFPAVADNDILNLLRKNSETNKIKSFIGINRTHDAFYGNQASIIKWGRYLLDEQWKNYDTPILSSDMESAVLFVVASLRGVKAGAILLANANPEPLIERLKGEKQKVVTESRKEKTEKDMQKMIRVALETIKEMSSA